jgi:hypothetical protein
MTTISNRRPWLAWGITAVVLGAVVPFTAIAVTNPAASVHGWEYWVSLGIGWACALALLSRAARLAIVDLAVSAGRVEVTARYLHKTVREGFPPTKRHRLDHDATPNVDGGPWHRAVLRTPAGNEYVFAEGPLAEPVEALVARFADAAGPGSYR